MKKFVGIGLMEKLVNFDQDGKTGGVEMRHYCDGREAVDIPASTRRG